MSTYLNLYPKPSVRGRRLKGRPGEHQRERRGAFKTPVVLLVAFELDSRRKFRQPEVGTPRRERHLRSLLLLDGASTTDHQDHDVRQRDTPVFVTSFVATSGPSLMHGRNRTLNTLVGDPLQAPYKSNIKTPSRKPAFA
uniref:Uncharacterized protein n=1 Tax=Ixodes ricinus TaxID=34613 RepID=A0A6B0UT95_IXORI